MTFIKDNAPTLVLAAVIVGLFVMVAAIGVNFRGGNPWTY